MFAGGAVGKLVCAFIGARIGVIATVCLTEGLTTLGILALLPLPLEAALVVLPVIGVMLNGTSSVLYGSVPELIEPAKRARAFGVFYTGTIGAGAVSPPLYGLVGDSFGVPTALIVVALACLLTLPLAAGAAAATAGHVALSIEARCRLPPIPEHRLDQRQRRDRRGVGAQDARPER